MDSDNKVKTSQNEKHNEKHNEKPIKLKKKNIIEFLDIDEEKVYASEMGGNYCSDIC